MKAIIVGAGQLGFEVASRLAAEGHDVIAVDQSEDRLSVIADQLDVLTVQGNGASPPLLASIIPGSDVLAAVTDSDETNLLSCLVAKGLGVKRCVARVRNNDYLKGPFQPLSPFDASVDMVINPDQLAALELARLVETPSVTYVDYFSDGRVTLIRLKVEPGAPITAGPLRDIRPKDCIVVGLIRDDEVLIPNGDTHIQAGDRVLLLGPTRQADSMRALVSPNSRRIRNVLIAGGGHMGEAVLRILLSKYKRGLRIAVIEKNPDRCHRLARDFPEALVIQGDAEKPDFLREAHVEETDACIAVLGSNHTNVLVAMLAKELGAREVMTTVTREEYVSLAEKAGADAVIVPRLLTASSIIKLLRRRHVLALSFLEEGQAQVMELIVNPGARAVGRPLQDWIRIRDMIIGSVVRDGRVIVPSGALALQPGDRVVVVTLSSRVQQVESWFQTE